MGMHPRWIKANTAYAQTQRTVDRQFLFKPDPVVTNIIGASAARAQRKHPINIYWLEFNINHEQTGVSAISDSKKHLNNLTLFKQTFHRLIAEEINRYYGREGAVFSTPARTIECLDDMSLEQQFLYALTNPVKDGLVDRIAHWKGFSSYNQLAQGNDETYTYIDRTAWHKDGGERSKNTPEFFTKTIRIKFTPLPSMAHMKPHQRQSHIRREVRFMERHFREERQKENRTAMGPVKLARTDPRSRPRTKPKRTPKPVCHCSCPEHARLYKEERLEFLKAYREASIKYLAGLPNVAFPQGSIKPPLITLAA